MIIRVNRFMPMERCTIGKLSIDGVDQGIYTLEDVVREIYGEPVQAWKIDGQTAIPKGKYKVAVTYSERFKRYLPLLMGVPGFDGIRIHPGNTDKDTSGCLLVGLEWSGGDFIGKSHEAFEYLYKRITEADFVEIEIG